MIGPKTQQEALRADAEKALAEMDVIHRHYTKALARRPGDAELECAVELAAIHRTQAVETLRLAS